MANSVIDRVNPLNRRVLPPPVPKRLVNHIALVVDTSGSMDHLTAKTNELINAQVDTIKQNAHESGQETYVSLYTFGERIRVHYLGLYPEAVPHANIQNTGDATALCDAVVNAITNMKNAKYATDPDTSFLIVVLTDGENNRNNIAGPRRIRDEFDAARRDGRWSFAILTPPGGTKHAIQFGFPEGNIQEWEQTYRGIERASAQASVGTSSYYTARASGQRSTSAFFTNLSKVKAKDLKKLDDVTGLYRKMKVDAEIPISDFFESKVGSYKIGNAFYQLTKTEAIQDHKDLIIEDKHAKQLFGGAGARELIGIAGGQGVTTKVTPGNHADYNIYVKSTSMNRKLVRGTTALYRKGA